MSRRDDKIIALLKSVASECETFSSSPRMIEHSWRKCRHCLAVEEFSSRQIRKDLGAWLASVTKASEFEILADVEGRKPVPPGRFSTLNAGDWVQTEKGNVFEIASVERNPVNLGPVAYGPMYRGEDGQCVLACAVVSAWRGVRL